MVVVVVAVGGDSDDMAYEGEAAVKRWVCHPPASCRHDRYPTTATCLRTWGQS